MKRLLNSLLLYFKTLKPKFEGRETAFLEMGGDIMCESLKQEKSAVSVGRRFFIDGTQSLRNERCDKGTMK
jgi:hypothetical protein